MEVTLRVGERATVRLPGLGTVGYRWASDVSGDAVAVSVRPAPREEIDGRPPGASVDEIAVIEGRHPGRATVTLEQRRSWENRPQPQDQQVIEVIVT
ncbi:protease inhibitor I42 family protein [Actinoplanes sp. NPDC051343]|uniref:protease inhibitor I42 family protein n=1 Tax=Actinoplanes sp. NPDC051343 TaxID=3363906 RepID=UPI0037981846